VIPDRLSPERETHTSRELHLLSVVPVAFLFVLLGYHPLAALPLVVGVLLPELDTVDDRVHRSWLLHTYLFPALLYWVLVNTGLSGTHPWLLTSIHLLTVGMTVHFLADYVYPKGMDHRGAVWPVRPVFFSAYWGLIWLGISWLIQWFIYLSTAFLPWLVAHVVPVG